MDCAYESASQCGSLLSFWQVHERLPEQRTGLAIQKPPRAPHHIAVNSEANSPASGMLSNQLDLHCALDGVPQVKPNGGDRAISH
jgi:hypothetical protein